MIRQITSSGDIASYFLSTPSKNLQTLHDLTTFGSIFKVDTTCPLDCPGIDPLDSAILSPLSFDLGPVSNY